MARFKTKEEIAHIREGGKRLSAVLAKVVAAVAPGVTTGELDELAERLIREGGNVPAFLGYKPSFSHMEFPGSLCTSVNDEVVHGIPGERVLEEGDIIGLDIGLIHEGLYTDMAMTVPVGEISPEVKKLLQVTRKSLLAAINAVKDGAHVGDVGAAVEAAIAVAGESYGIVEELGGHGVGHEVHEPPFIPHSGKAGQGDKLETGMVIAIEPMLTAGKKAVNFLPDGYTVETRDGSLAAHFEATMAVTEKGAEVLTPLVPLEL